MLDASTRTDVLNILGDLASRGLGVLFITHDLSLGHYISDPDGHPPPRAGRRDCGATRKVFSTRDTPYTKMLLDSVPRLNAKWSNGHAPAAAAVDDGAIGPLIEVEPGHFVASEAS